MRTQYSVCFLFDLEFKQVLLVKKDTSDKPDQSWQHGQLNGIGGKLENFESMQECLCREFEEETGIKVEDQPKWKHAGCIQDFNKCIYLVEVYYGVAPLEILRKAKKQPNEKDEPAIYYLPLVLSHWHNVADDVAELIHMILMVHKNELKGKFRRFEILTD